jgi:hypothetical protein
VPRLALYTTVYPAVEPYLADWWSSVRDQTDGDFTLWIALDGMDERAAADAMGAAVEAHWVRGGPEETTASIRQTALDRLCRSHEAAVLVDSDDVLHPTRVATAREMLETYDVAGCALRVVDERGRSAGRTFALPAEVAPEDVFPRANVFGLSNTAVRCDLLRRCLPIPREAALVDWYLWTRAWLAGARFGFSDRPEMDYRQYGANTARVLGPITARQVAEDTGRVQRHYRLVLASDLAGALPERLEGLKLAAASVDVFAGRVVASPEALARYADALNLLPGAMVWWQWVAHPALRHLWEPVEGETWA